MPREIVPSPTSIPVLPIGVVIAYIHDVPPVGWLLCDGSDVRQSQYPQLFALVGTRFGVAAEGYFRLPDIRGRVIIGSGQGSGLSLRTLGEQGGEQMHTLTIGELPAHAHAVRCYNFPGNSGTPTANYPAAHKLIEASALPVDESYSTTYNSTMNPDAVTPTGGGSPHENMPPFLVLNFIIRAL